MIIPNGYIRFVRKSCSECGTDPDTGYPVEGLRCLGGKIPCQYTVREMDLQGKTEGNPVTVRRYELLLDSPLPERPSEQVMLYGDCGRLAGEFPVRSSEELRAVSQIRITL